MSYAGSEGCAFLVGPQVGAFLTATAVGYKKELNV